MKPQLLFAAILFSLNAWSAPDKDSIPLTRIQAPICVSTSKPAFRLTAKDIERLPFTNIIEVINARFPFVFSDPPSSSLYTFIIDGYVALNVNAINVSQIALIEFYPVSFDAASGTLTSRGTFVVTTKLRMPMGEGGTRTKLTVRSQGGRIFSTDKTYQSPGSGVNRIVEDDYFTHQELAYDNSIGKVQLSAAGAYTRNANPAYELVTQGSTFSQTADHGFNRWRLSAMADYNATNKLRFSLALLGTLVKNNSGGESSIPGRGPLSKYDADTDVKYGGAALAVDYHPGAFFNNSLQLQYAHMNTTGDGQVINFALTPGGSNLYRDDDNTTKTPRMAVVNTSRGIFNSNSPVEIGWQLTLRYHEFRDKSDYTSVTRQENGPPLSMSVGSFKRNERTIGAMPGLSVRIRSNFVAQAGVVYESWKLSEFPGDKSNEVMPYGGIQWNIPMHGDGLSALAFHSTYGEALQFNYRNDMLDMYSRPGFNPAQGPYSAFGQTDPGYTWISGVNAGFVKNRIKLAVNYLTGNGFPAVYIPIFGGGYILDYREVERSGASVDLQAAIAESQKFSCKFRTVLFYERIKLKEQLPSTFIYYDNPALNDDLSPQWRGSASLDITAGGFFLQAQGILRFNDEGYNTVQMFADRKSISNHGLTFLVAGYSFYGRKKKTSDAVPTKWSISVQTRNLILMEEPRGSGYYGSRYVGVGANVSL